MTPDQWKVFTLLPKDGKEISVREVAEKFFNKIIVNDNENETVKNLLQQIYFIEINTEAGRVSYIETNPGLGMYRGKIDVVYYRKTVISS